MRAVQLDSVEARPLGAHRRSDEVLFQSLDFVQRQRPRARFGIVRRTDWLSTDELARRTHPGMVQLHDRDGARPLHGRSQPGQALEMRVREDAELAGKSAPLCLDMRRAGHREPESPCGTQRQPAELLVRQPAVLVALAVGERRQHEAVLHCRATREGQRCEQVGHASLD